jgi:hypothetical protein
MHQKPEPQQRVQQLTDSTVIDTFFIATIIFDFKTEFQSLLGSP